MAAYEKYLKYQKCSKKKIELELNPDWLAADLIQVIEIRL